MWNGRCHHQAVHYDAIIKLDIAVQTLHHLAHTEHNLLHCYVISPKGLWAWL